MITRDQRGTPKPDFDSDSVGVGVGAGVNKPEIFGVGVGFVGNFFSESESESKLEQPPI
jgi:hypothetical protein